MSGFKSPSQKYNQGFIGAGTFLEIGAGRTVCRDNTHNINNIRNTGDSMRATIHPKAIILTKAQMAAVSMMAK